MSNYKSDCRKFQPNIFNKSKCTTCFRAREEHSAEALESNRIRNERRRSKTTCIMWNPRGGELKGGTVSRGGSPSCSSVSSTPGSSPTSSRARKSNNNHHPASRKVSKCGYLFVAPDWDFSVPLNRTKRWQRRWFVLYDDGELTYSVDDHPATIPQGVINMTRVQEVAMAEDVTGNQYSLAITAPERITFVKGTCKEESRWWLDVLSVFPRAHSHKSGRHKRNATFPGIKSTTILKQSMVPRSATTTLAPTTFESPLGGRVRFHSCTTDPVVGNSNSLTGRPPSAPVTSEPLDCDDVFPTKDPSTSTTTTTSPPTPIYHSTPLSSLPASTRMNKENTPPYTEDYTDNPPTSESPPTQDKLSHKLRSRRAVKREARGLTQPRSGGVSRQLMMTDLEESKREEKLKDIADSITRLRGSHYRVSKSGHGNVAPTRECDPQDEVDGGIDSNKSTMCDTTDSLTEHNIRGSPDGCVLETGPVYTTNPDLPRVDLPAEDLLYIKKGWLMKQTLTQEWNKFWFVLRGTGLMFYRDPSAEDNGILDGIIDLSIIKSVEEYEVQRNYGFTCMTWEEKKYVFSAVTSGIRANWVQALRNAANLKEDKNRPLSLGEKIEREISAKRDRHNSQGSNIESIAAERDKGSDIINSSVLSINTHRYIISSDEEYRTASEPSTGSQSINNTEDYFEWERVRSRSNSRSRISKRSKSSPPNSRRGTRDDFPIMNKGEVLNPCFSETGSVHSITDLDDTHPEKDSSATTLTGTGDALLVDLLETQVESLKAKLEQTQADYLNLHKENSGLKTRLKVSGISIPFKNSPSGKYHQDQDILQFQSSDVNILEQSPSSLSPAKLELKLSEAKEAIASLTADLARLRKKVKVCEGDLERSENEVEKLRRDKGDAANEAVDLRRRVASLEMQIKELLDRVEEQEHDLVEKTTCANQLNEMRKKYNELLQRVSGQNHSPDKVDWKQHYEDLEKRFFHEREEWEERLSSQELRLVEANVNNTAHKDETMRKMTRSLKEAEQRINKLVAELEEERSIRRTKRKETELDKQVEQLSVDLSKMRDNLKSEKSEVYKWKDLVKELRSLLDGKNDDIEKKREEVDKHRENMKTTQKELDHTADRLHRGIEENESLCTRIRELERQAQFNDKIRQSSSTLSISSSRERFSSKKNLPRMDSLSDLTNVNLLVEPRELDKEQLAEEYSELGIRFEKAVNEIRALRREIRESQNQHDELDLLNVKLKQDLKTQEDDFTSQHNLLADRVQDLSNKLSASEKQVRTLKQKLSRTESRDRRRTLSLKGKESFALSRDMEQKLSQLEAKVESLLQEGTTEVVLEDTKEQATGDQAMKMPKRSRSFDESTKSSRLRRKSLDSPVNSDSMKNIVRLNTLEAKVGCINGEEKILISSSSSTKSSSRPKSPTHPASPLRSPLRSPSMQRKNIRSPRATPEKTVKLSRSDSESKILRERLSGLEKVLTSLQTQLTECVAWAGSVECVCSCGAPGMSSLKQSLSCAVRITQLRHSPKDLTAAPRVRPMAVRMQDMLREKLTDLYNRRDHLKNCGKWTRDSQLKLFAERLSYETLVLTQVAQVMQAVHRPESYQSSVKLQELIEAHRKLSFLEKKLTNPDFDMDTMSPLDFYTSLLAEKLVVQGELASNLSQNGSASQRLTDNSPPQLSQTCLDLQKRLLDRERSLANLVTNYKEGKLHEIAIVMARETISGTSPPHDDSILLEEVRMREAWSIAQDLLTQDLVNTEAAQSLMRLCELLTPAESSDSVSSQINNMTASTMERWQTASEESLRQEMEEAVFTLSNKYEEVLAQYRAGDTGIVNSVTIPMEGLLAEFAAVVAQKAMIDGQLAVVQNENESPSSASEPLAIVEETRDNLGAASDVVASEAHLLMFLGGCDSSMENLVQPALDQSEFTFLFNKMGVACNSDINKLVLQSASHARTEVLPLTKSVQGAILEDKGKDDENSYTSLPSPTKSLSSPKTRRKSESRKYRRASDITGMADGCRQCEEMRQEIAKLKRSLDSKRAKEREAECKHCVEYINKLKALEQDHRIALSGLNTQHGQDMSRLREQLDHEPPTRDSDDELTELKRRLGLLEEGYETQINALKKQYQDSLEAAGTSHPDLCEENIRQRYQVEISQLRGLCEKGLGAMENSHKRMLTELEEKHRRETAALQAEKEQALAEETQATLAALDAMRKAHEAEVQREIAKFKEEFIRKMTSGHDIGAIHKEHEAEMEDIRTEILSLSEKYSIKCLESAALEGKLDGVNKQLTDANKQIFDLEARNKQLKTHLSAKVSQGQQDMYKDSSSQLGIRESELVLCNEEISRLNQQLQQTKSHEADLGELCRQLGHFLKAERQLRTDEVSSLREKLEHIILTAATMQDPHSDVTTNGNSKDKSPFRRGASLNASHSKDLIRSPSCPRLSGFSSFLSVGPTQGGITGPASTMDLPSPLAGMVASRKKVFETTPVKGSVDIL